MKGTGYLTITNTEGVHLQGAGKLEVNNTPVVVFTGTGELNAESWRSGVIDVSLPSLGCVLADKTSFGMLNVDLPALTVFMEEAYVPPSPQSIYGNLPPLVFSGRLVRTRKGDIDVSIPPLTFKAGDESGYAEIIVDLPALVVGIMADRDPGTANFYNQMFTSSSLDRLTDHVVFLSSTGQVVDTISGTKELIASMLEALRSSGTVALHGSFLVTASEVISGHHEIMASVKGAPGLDGSARIWVVNTETSASSQYDDYGFNSFFESEGKYYGVADDGIYELDGDDDAGAEIQALVETGRSDLGTPQKKRLYNVYAGVSSEGTMLLKVDADEQVYYYAARSSSAELKNHRFGVGKGLKGNYYNFTLLNQGGGDFDLESIHFEPISLSRKI